MKANSFTAFGEMRSKYLELLPCILRQHYVFYPEWRFIVMTDRAFDSKEKMGIFVSKMYKDGLLDVVNLNKKNTASGKAMLWRMAPIWDKEIDYVCCRDLDSILTPRQLKYTLRFIDSGVAAHGINDNIAHDIPMMGGMVAFNCKKFKEITSIDSFDEMMSLSNSSDDKWEIKGEDQIFLMKYIYPKIKDSFILDKPDGPNERYLYKNCVEGVDVSYVPKDILERGDDFANYIGASCNRFPQNDINDFYDKYGSDICKYISRMEKEILRG